MGDDRNSLRKQLVDFEENLRLLRERKAKYVLESDIPLQLEREEKRLVKRIQELQAALDKSMDAAVPWESRAWLMLGGVVILFVTLIGLGLQQWGIGSLFLSVPAATPPQTEVRVDAAAESASPQDSVNSGSISQTIMGLPSNSGITVGEVGTDDTASTEQHEVPPESADASAAAQMAEQTEDEEVSQEPTLELDETDPAKLFELAAFSYLESNAHAAALYFERAIDTGELSPLQETFATLSMDRLENPEKYEGSIGVMVAGVTEGGNFAAAGLQIGDVILALDEEVVNEPLDIASALARADGPVLLTVLRADAKQLIEVRPNESAGALLTQLVILNAIQL